MHTDIILGMGRLWHMYKTWSMPSVHRALNLQLALVFCTLSLPLVSNGGNTVDCFIWESHRGQLGSQPELFPKLINACRLMVGQNPSSRNEQVDVAERQDHLQIWDMIIFFFFKRYLCRTRNSFYWANHLLSVSPCLVPRSPCPVNHTAWSSYIKSQACVQKQLRK